MSFFDLAGLNRDIEKAREITKNEKVNVDVYIDPAAIEAVIDGAVYVYEKINPKATSRGENVTAEDVKKYYEDIYQQEIAKGADPTSAKLAVMKHIGIEEFICAVDVYVAQYGSFEDIPAPLINSLLTKDPLMRAMALGFVDEATAALASADDFVQGTAQGTAEIGAGALKFVYTYVKGAVVYPLTGGKQAQEENAFAVAVTKEIALLPLKAITGELSTEFKGTLDKALNDLNKADNAFDRGRALVHLLSVSSVLFAPEALAANPGRAAQFPHLAAASQKVAKPGGIKPGGSTIVSDLPPLPSGSVTIPGRVQSRINVTNDGFSHALQRHLNPEKNASQFTISEAEIRGYLMNKDVIKGFVVPAPNKSGNFYRTVDVGRVIGTDMANGFSPTTKLTIVSDKYGNLQTVFPGVFK